ncbi:MAG: LptF/LptG family permease [Bacteroidota bacterium]
MKRIDKLLLKSFIAPFIATFFIALFVLIMQFLWTYIDDIVGKGAGILILSELLFYLSISLIPTALPIAVLISSVMVMGNLAENYELASLKSAGVPLLRIMQPLMFLTATIACFSFFCSNNLIPLANLKFKSRLYDIRKQKPTLSLEEGVFNDDFKDIIIHIGEKGEDNVTIKDILIYDHSNYNRDRASVITAKSGEMYATADQRYFVMNLFDGSQYQEMQTSGTGKEKNSPFMRTSFKEWTRVFDLSEFEINRTHEELFKSHQTMLSAAQLVDAIDSIDVKIQKRFDNLGAHMSQYFYYVKDSVEERNSRIRDSVKYSRYMQNKPFPINKAPSAAVEKKQEDEMTKAKEALKAKREKQQQQKEKKGKKKKKSRKLAGKIVKQRLDRPLEEYESIFYTFQRSEQGQLVNKAKSFARGIQGQAKTTFSSLGKIKESKVKHIYELNIKFSMALVCFIFLFIGAPMGAIVRKGGFGYPILIAIIFFMLFIVLNVMCKKLAESFVVSANFAAWIPCMILFPIGLMLTFKAMNDSKIINIAPAVSKLEKWLTKSEK